MFLRFLNENFIYLYTEDYAMRSLLLLILLIPSMLYAVSLQDFVTPYLYEDENYTSSVQPIQIQHGAETYILVRISGEDVFLLRRTLLPGNETDYSLVEDINETYEILKGYEVETNYPSEEEIAEIKEAIERFNSSRFPEETRCKDSVGLSIPGAHCTPERCESCMSVPSCADKMPYFGSDFLLAISDFERDTDGLEESISNAYGNVSSISSESDAYLLLNETFNNLDKANAYATAIDANHLFGCDVPQTWCWHPTDPTYAQFCYSIKFNYTSLSEAISKTNALRARVSSHAVLLERAGDILNRTAQRKEDRLAREKAEEFQRFFQHILDRYERIKGRADRLLAHINDTELRSDMTSLDGFVNRIAQYGAQTNYSAANLTAQHFFVLADKVENYTDNLTEKYDGVLEKANATEFALFRAELFLEPNDYSLKDELMFYAAQKEALDDIMNGTSTLPEELDGIGGEYDGIRAGAISVISAKRSQRASQLASWFGDAARLIGEGVIGLVNAIIPMSLEQKEVWAKRLPPIVVISGGVLFYVFCLLLFFILVKLRVIRYLHKVAIFLWFIIFLFLLVLIGLSTLTVHSLVIHQSQRSTFDLFSNALIHSQRAAVIVVEGNETQSERDLMEGCASSLVSNLTTMNMTVDLYRFENTTCLLSNGTALERHECISMIGDSPTFYMSYGHHPSVSFYVFYSKSAKIIGDEGFYSKCLIARVFNESG